MSDRLAAEDGAAEDEQVHYVVSDVTVVNEQDRFHEGGDGGYFSCQSRGGVERSFR